MENRQYLTGKERFFPENEIIVSKTDAKGRMVYVNDVFLDVSGYEEEELIGKPHSLIRHPAMPRSVFKLFWQTIQQGREIFAYVNNRAKGGDNYWVLAHATPSYGSDGQVSGYHSSRRSPRRDAVAKIGPLYAELAAEEDRHNDRGVGMQSAYDMLLKRLASLGVGYDEFVFSL